MSALPVPSRLDELEDVIERGLATFVEVGTALLEIRDSRLYRETHDTFEFYCRERWNMRRESADRLVRAAETLSALNPIGLTDGEAMQTVAPLGMAAMPLPTSEAVTRELAPLRHEPEVLREAWSEAVEQHGPTPTASQVREVVDTRSRGQLSNQSGGTDEWATPQDFFDVVNAEFDFTLDVCALDSSAKCARYFTPETDGLSKTWTGTVWMNPPYGNEIVDWIRKAYESGQAGATVVCLVPARVDTGWWWDFCRHGEVRFLRGRLRFGEAEASAPFPSVLVVFGRGTSTSYWEWR